MLPYSHTGQINQSTIFSGLEISETVQGGRESLTFTHWTSPCQQLLCQILNVGNLILLQRGNARNSR